jgi:hypothetical protein
VVAVDALGIIELCKIWRILVFARQDCAHARHEPAIDGLARSAVPPASDVGRASRFPGLLITLCCKRRLALPLIFHHQHGNNGVERGGEKVDATAPL